MLTSSVAISEVRLERVRIHVQVHGEPREVVAELVAATCITCWPGVEAPVLARILAGAGHMKVDAACTGVVHDVESLTQPAGDGVQAVEGRDVGQGKEPLSIGRVTAQA